MLVKQSSKFLPRTYHIFVSIDFLVRKSFYFSIERKERTWIMIRLRIFVRNFVQLKKQKLISVAKYLQVYRLVFLFHIYSLHFCILKSAANV